MTTGPNNYGQPGPQPGGFGSNGAQQGVPGNGMPQMGQMDPNMLRLLMPDLFGEPLRESAYEDAVFAGSVRRGGELEIGTFSIMILKPDATHPQAEMVVRTNGMVTTTPERLKKIGDAFLRWAKDTDLVEALNEAQQEESGAQGEMMLNSLVRKEGGFN